MARLFLAGSGWVQRSSTIRIFLLPPVAILVAANADCRYEDPCADADCSVPRRQCVDRSNQIPTIFWCEFATRAIIIAGGERTDHDDREKFDDNVLHIKPDLVVSGDCHEVIHYVRVWFEKIVLRCNMKGIQHHSVQIQYLQRQIASVKM